VLFIIDQDRYRLALADAEGALAVRQTQHLTLKPDQPVAS